MHNHAVVKISWDVFLKCHLLHAGSLQGRQMQWIYGPLQCCQCTFEVALALEESHMQRGCWFVVCLSWCASKNLVLNSGVLLRSPVLCWEGCPENKIQNECCLRAEALVKQWRSNYQSFQACALPSKITYSPCLCCRGCCSRRPSTLSS